VSERGREVTIHFVFSSLLICILGENTFCVFFFFTHRDDKMYSYLANQPVSFVLEGVVGFNVTTAAEIRELRSQLHQVCCSVLQCVAVYCSVLQCIAVCCSVFQYVAVCCSAKFANYEVSYTRCAAVCCSVLQCVAVCCSVLRFVAVC